jgi:hypothetical protein
MKVTNIKLHVNPSSGSRAATCRHTDGQTDRQADGRTNNLIQFQSKSVILWWFNVTENNKRYLGLMQRAWCFCLILTKFGFSQQILTQASSIKFHKHPSSGSHADMCGQTGKMKVTGTFSVNATAPKIKSVGWTAAVKHTSPVFKRCEGSIPTSPERYVSVTLNHPQKEVQSTPGTCCVVYQIYRAISNTPHSEQHPT